MFRKDHRVHRFVTKQSVIKVYSFYRAVHTESKSYVGGVADVQAEKGTVIARQNESKNRRDGG